MKKLKHVVQYASFAAYHLSLETSFLEDEGAMLPKLPVGPSVTLPKKLIEADDLVSTTSSLAAPSAYSHEKDVSNCELDTKNLSLSSDIKHLDKDILEPSSDLQTHSDFSEQTNSCNTDAFSAPCSENNTGLAFGSISDVCVCGLTGSYPGFCCKQLTPLSPLHTDISNHQREVLEKSVKERSNFASDRFLRSDEHKKSDSAIKNEVPGDYFSTADNHQSILVSLSSTCIKKNRVCERSQLFRIKFYGSFDKPLGRYLRDDLFDEVFFLCQWTVQLYSMFFTHSELF